MKKLSWLLAAAAVCMFVAPVAYALDDCCWDWSPKEPGKDDPEPGSKGKEDPYNLDTHWAVCVSRTTFPRPNGSPCFQRNGRQMIWPDWQCLVGSPSDKPGDPLPPQDPNGRWLGGFWCQKKAGVIQLMQMKDGPSPDPNIPDIVEGKGPPTNVPTLSTTGMVIMMILLVVAAGWMLRRKGAAPTSAA